MELITTGVPNFRLVGDFFLLQLEFGVLMSIPILMNKWSWSVRVIDVSCVLIVEIARLVVLRFDKSG